MYLGAGYLSTYSDSFCLFLWFFSRFHGRRLKARDGYRPEDPRSGGGPIVQRWGNRRDWFLGGRGAKGDILRQAE